MKFPKLGELNLHVTDSYALLVDHTGSRSSVEPSAARKQLGGNGWLKVTEVTENGRIVETWRLPEHEQHTDLEHAGHEIERVSAQFEI
jgi:hypothetical protein